MLHFHAANDHSDDHSDRSHATRQSASCAMMQVMVDVGLRWKLCMMLVSWRSYQRGVLEILHYYSPHPSLHDQLFII